MEIHQVSQEIWTFISSVLTIVNFLSFFAFTCYKKTNDVSIYKIILGIILKGCLRIALSYISIGFVLSIQRLGGIHTDPPRINYFKKTPAFKP